MEFHIENHSSVSVVSQIEEQIKFAVMMGVFRNGDILPSIRDIEKQTGVHRSQIHKAYLALRRSGLIVLMHGKGSVVSDAIDVPSAVSKNCTQLCRQVISKARQLGMSPTAFARCLSRQAQESERTTPFISYIDDSRELAEKTAAEISQSWQIPVRGLAYQELKTVMAKGNAKHKILVNHVMYKYVCSLLPKRKSAIIPLEVRVSNQTIKLLAAIKPNSSVLLIHQPQPSYRLRYMLAQIQGLIKSPGVKLFSSSFQEISDIGALLNSSQYDYYLIGPAVRRNVPDELQHNPRIMQIDPQPDASSLETARIRAGVVI